MKTHLILTMLFSLCLYSCIYVTQQEKGEKSTKTETVIAEKTDQDLTTDEVTQMLKEHYAEKDSRITVVNVALTYKWDVYERKYYNALITLSKNGKEYSRRGDVYDDKDRNSKKPPAVEL